MPDLVPDRRTFGLHLNDAHLQRVLEVREHWRRTLGHDEAVAVPRVRVVVRLGDAVLYDSRAQLAVPATSN